MTVLTDLSEGLLARLRRAHDTVRRATLIPMLVRGGVFLANAAALVTAYPSQIVLGRGLLPLLMFAALPALAPRGVLPVLAALAAVAGWVVSTVGLGEPVTFGRVAGLGSALYVAHCLAALAAVLPYDAIAEPEVLARWLTRAFVVVVASAALALALLIAATVWGGEPLLAASLSGLGVAVGVAALLAWLLRRRG